MQTHEQIFRAASATRSEPRPGTRHRLLYLSLLLLALSTNCDVLQGAVPILGRLFPGISSKMGKQAELIVEVQDSLLRFADEYSMRMVGGVDNLRRGTDALSPAEVLHLKIAIPSQAISLRWRKWSTRRLLVIRFFGIHFISALTEEALLTFDHRDGRWRWDLSRIQARG